MSSAFWNGFTPVFNLWADMQDLFPFLALVGLGIGISILLWIVDYLRGGSA